MTMAQDEGAAGTRARTSNGNAWPSWARWTMIGLTLTWAVVMWAVARPESLTWDYNGWRQADTQQMAEFQAQPGSSILMPRIAWGGAGPGYVEAEMQVYAGVVGLILRAVGEAEWPGQLVSLLCMAVGIAALSWEAGRRFGAIPGLVALLALLSCHGTLALSTSVQPDTMAFGFAALGFVTFLRYADSERRSALAIAMGLTFVAACCKPTALHIGVSQFLYVWWTNRKLLASKQLWLGWFGVLALTAMYLWHAHTLYTVYGNSFGVITGDRKFPTLRSLFAVRLHLSLLKNMAEWGVTWLGVAALLLLAWRKRLDALLIAPLVGYALLMLTAQRLTAHPFWGSHYHIAGLIPGSLLIAAGTREAATLVKPALWDKAWLRPLLATAAVVLFAASLADGLHTRLEMAGDNADSIGFIRLLKTKVAPGQLVAVRSSQGELTDPFWGAGPNNYQDPRYFYETKTHGWVLPVDALGVQPVQDVERQGATYYIEPAPPLPDATLEGWLKQHATLVLSHPGGRLFELKPHG